jgi:hypothetical protein
VHQGTDVGGDRRLTLRGDGGLCHVDLLTQGGIVRPRLAAAALPREHGGERTVRRRGERGRAARRRQDRRAPGRPAISIIEEAQPRWLAFLEGRHDYIDRVPNEFIQVAMPGGKVAPNLAKQGVRGVVTPIRVRASAMRQRDQDGERLP